MISNPLPCWFPAAFKRRALKSRIGTFKYGDLRRCSALIQKMLSGSTENDAQHKNFG
jgi:hypothetical protein